MGSRPTYGRQGHDKVQPPGRKAQAEKLRVITSAEQLELYTYQKCRSSKVFPKKDRLLLPNRMIDEASDILADIMDANDYDLRLADESALRISCQRNALRNLRKLIHHIRLVRQLQLIDDRVFEFWTKLANSTKNQTAAWHKNDKERLKGSRL